MGRAKEQNKAKKFAEEKYRETYTEIEDLYTELQDLEEIFKLKTIGLQRNMTLANHIINRATECLRYLAIFTIDTAQKARKRLEQKRTHSGMRRRESKMMQKEWTMKN